VSVPHFKDEKLSTRRDVVSKTILRIMKRYFVQIFKEMYPKLKLKVNSIEEYLESAKQFLSTLNGEISSNDHIKYFIAQMVSLKLTAKFEVNNQMKGSLKLLDSCLYSYSDKAMNKLFKDSSAKILFNYFFENGQRFFGAEKNVVKNLSEYSCALKGIYVQFNNS